MTTDREGQLLEELRPAAFAIAYRMLGSVAEAEDVVQESLFRVHRALEDDERIGSPRAYVGEWLPEPLVSERGNDADDPARHAEMADSLSLAFLVLLETLSPEQRATLLLHDVFDYSYAEIFGKSEDNTRQLATRARRHVEERRPRFEPSRERRDELARRFFAATQEGDMAALESLLAHDVVLHGDGVSSIVNPDKLAHLGPVGDVRALMARRRDP